MDNLLICPDCHIQVRETDYFCFNCGKNLRSAPPSTSMNRQIIVYLESFFLPPYGIIIGIRYLRENNRKSKTVGVIAIVLTLISLLFFVKVMLDLTKIINTQVNNQLQDVGM